MDESLYHQIQKVEQSHWWYVARRKIIFDWVLRSLERYPDPKILDIGCGTGVNVSYLQSNGYHNVVGLDISPTALSYCKSRDLTRLVLADGTRPAFRAETFDMVMALDLIEHIEHDSECLCELQRLLKPGGSVMIFTPAFKFLWGLQDQVSHHFRRYTAGDLRHKIEMSGLVIDKLTYVNTFLFPLIWAGRTVMRFRTKPEDVVSENDLHPGWSNGILEKIFASELPLLRNLNFPFGVSLLCVAHKP